MNMAIAVSHVHDAVALLGKNGITLSETGLHVAGVLRILHDKGSLEFVGTPIHVRHPVSISFDRTGTTLLTVDRLVFPFGELPNSRVN
jgi:hypothetical protein